MSKDNRRPEDLGSMGESFFNSLCKDIGFIANSSKSDDKGGWDFAVEHRGTEQINYSNQSYPVYRVQVKSTTRKYQTKLSFSNILKLIQYQGPSFLVLFKYSESVNPESAFIVHMDENFSISILKEIREKQIRSKKFSLNKTERIVKFSPEEEIRPLSGRGLLESFKKYVGNDYLAYVENKLKYLSKFEREGRRREYKWTFRSEQDLKAMANCFLGYQEKFNIQVSEYYTPFGIGNNIPITIFDDYNTTITPHHNELPKEIVSLRTSKFGKRYDFTGTLYIIPKEIRSLSSKVRIKCNLFDFIFDFETYFINLEFNLFSEDINTNLKELCNLINFINNSMDNKEIYIMLIDPKSENKAEVCVGPPDYNLPNNFLTIFKAINSTYKKFCEYNLENEIISTQYIWDNIGRFHLFTLIGNTYNPNFEMEFKSKGECIPGVNVVVFVSTIQFDNKSLLTFVAFHGSVEKVRKNIFYGSFNKSELLGDFLLGHEDDYDALLDIKTKEFEDSLTERGFKVLR